MTNTDVHYDPALVWIYGIFSACQIRYGRRFLGQYEGIAHHLVHRDWARVLRAYEFNPVAIKWALDNLPDAPLMASQFRALCASAPQPATKLLPPATLSAQSRDQLRAFNDQLRSVVCTPVPGKAWAQQVLERVARGEQVSYAAKRNAMQAMGVRA